MSKPRKIKDEDAELTKWLNLAGYVAVGGNTSELYIKNADASVPLCERCQIKERMGIKPKCGCRMRNHGKFEKTYYDVVRVEDGGVKVVTIHYVFYKYRCLDRECPTVYQKPIEFARENAHVTKRFEDYVVSLASVMSYSFVSTNLMIKFRSNEAITRVEQTASKQGVSDIIKRWTAAKELERGNIHTPRILGMMKFQSNRTDYVIACDAGKNELRIIELFSPMDQQVMESFLRKLDLSVLEGVVTDCEPIVIEACENTLPNVKVMVCVDALMKQAAKEFAFLIHKDAAHIENYKKDILKKNPGEVAMRVRESRVIKEVTSMHPLVGLGYDYVNRLRAIFSRDWDIVEIKAWGDDAPYEIKDFFSTSSLYVSEYWDKMLNYYMRRNEVSGELYEHLQNLNRKINGFRIYSEELFKARLLYIPEAYDESIRNENEWCGVPYEVILSALDDMIMKKEDAIYERIQ